MGAIEKHQLRIQPYFNFLVKALNKEQFEVIQLAGDASNRRYYRVIDEEQSWVLMEWEPFPEVEKYPFLNVLEHFRRNQVQVPKVITYSSEEGFVLLEDLGDLTLERKFWENQNQDIALPFYRMAIDELLKIHYACSRDRAHSCVAFNVAFDTEKLLWEMNYARKHLIEGVGRVRMTEVESKMLDETFFKICETLSQEPRFISHRDYHSRNLMIKFNKIRVIDFQDARMGPVQYDLVSLLRDSYVNLSEPIGRSMIDYYLVRRSEMSEEPVSRDRFKEIYEIQTIQRCFKACGSFASFYNTRQDTRYLKYIRKTLNQVRGSLMYNEGSNLFLKFLEDHGFFEKDFEKP